MNTPHRTTEELLALIARQEQRIKELEADLIDPGFGLPVAAHTLRVLRSWRDDRRRVDAYRCDLDHLKQLNGATGSEARTDELVRPALTVRAADQLFAGKTDGGDSLLYVFPAGQGRQAMTRIQHDLRAAPLTPLERQRYARGVAEKRYGPFIGRARYGLYTAGLLPMADSISMTVVPFEGVQLSDLETIFYDDIALFEAKAAGYRGQLIKQKGPAS